MHTQTGTHTWAYCRNLLPWQQCRFLWFLTCSGNISELSLAAYPVVGNTDTGNNGTWCAAGPRDVFHRSHSLAQHGCGGCLCLLRQPPQPPMPGHLLPYGWGDGEDLGCGGGGGCPLQSWGMRVFRQWCNSIPLVSQVFVSRGPGGDRDLRWWGKRETIPNAAAELSFQTEPILDCPNCVSVFQSSVFLKTQLWYF